MYLFNSILERAKQLQKEHLFQKQPRLSPTSPFSFQFLFYMNNRTSFLHDLQHLQRIESRKLSKPPLLRVGFNQKRKPSKLASLHTVSQYERLFKAEQQLLQDLKQIDSSLQQQHLAFSYHNGYLFAQGLAHDLTGRFLHLITSRSEAVENGFSIWRVSEEQGTVRLVGGRLGHSPPNFSHKLTQKSLQKIQQYNSQKHQESIKQAPKPWQHFSKGIRQHLRLRTQQTIQKRQRNWDLRILQRGRYKQRTEMNRKLTENSSIFESQLSMLDMKHSNNSAQKTSPQQSPNSKPFSFSEISPCPSYEELHKMLNKQARILSIWTPPSSYPQLLAVLSLQIREKDVRTRSCHLSKYYITKLCFSRRLANCILDWASKQYGLIDQLAATTNKISFDGVFSCQGWKIKSWVREDRVRIVYRRVIL